MYARYFGMRGLPFSGQPGAAALYCRTPQRQRMAALRTALFQGPGAVALIGAPGSGKTTLCRLLLRVLPANAEVFLVTHPPRGLRELLHRVLEAPKFNDPGADASTGELVDYIDRELGRSRQRGRQPVLIIDDAQELAADTLAELLQWRSRDARGKPPFSLLLVGRPELEAIRDANGHDVFTRIGAIERLEPLALADAADYIRHRVKTVGGSQFLFTEAALRALHKAAEGNVRRLDILCDQALMSAFFANRESVDWRVVQMTLSSGRPIETDAPPNPWPHMLRVTAVFASAFVGTLLLVVWWAQMTGFGHRAGTEASPEPPPADVAAPAPAQSPASVADAGAPPSYRDLPAHPAARRAAAERSLLARARPGTILDASREGLCPALDRTELRCLDRRGSWHEIRGLNRPAMLALRDADGTRYYLTVTGVGADDVQVDLAGREHAFRQADFARDWQGDYTVLWQPPLPGLEYIGPDSPEPALRWLRSALASAQGSPVPNADPGHYDWALTQRVAQFQRAAGLDANGIADPATIMALEQAVGTGHPSQLAAADSGR
ncbi:MAG: ExeA family protein [Gammaproteobacteria bacterium]